MLLRQNRSRHQIYHLLALLNGLKCSTNGHLCLAVTYVTANQAVHNFGAFHILFGCFDSTDLVRCLLIRKHFLKLSLPNGIRPILKTCGLLPVCIEFHQIPGYTLYCGTHFLLGFGPFLCAQLTELRYLGVCRTVFL